MKLLHFFVVHSLRDMWRNRSRTLFALVCVATGVAAVVALRSLAFMVGDKLTSNLAEVNRGDIRVVASDSVPEMVQLSGLGNTTVFTREVEQIIRRWAAEESVDLTTARLQGDAALRRVIEGQAETPQQVLTFFVEPEYYPFYDTIPLLDVEGGELADAFDENGGEVGAAASILLPKLAAASAVMAAPWGELASTAWGLYPTYLVSHPRPLVVPSNLTHENSLGLQVGDIVRLGAADTLYEVRGVVPSSAETILTVPQMLFFNYRYVYLPIDDLPIQGDQALPKQIFIRVPLGQDIESVEASLVKYLDATLQPSENIAKRLQRFTVPQLEKDNAEVAGVIDDVILVMGLSSLLIGGIGIINTMLVVVSRRTLEIAVLKTLGLKGYRVTALFLVEAALMGLLGSLFGIVLGVVLSYLVRGVGEEAFQLSLTWRLYPEAIFSGLFLGIVVTVLFGFLPTLIAGQVRPAIVLRPNEAQMPAAGLLQILLTLVIMIVILGLMVDSVVEGVISFSPVYMITGAGALFGLFMGVIVGNTRLGQPIPDHAVFRLSRRFERFENGLTGAAGRLTAPVPVARWRGLMRRDRGRYAITAGLRMLRQVVLLYGAAAIGAALASGVFLVLSEVWLPFGIGASKPPGYVVTALNRGDLDWLVAWGMLVLFIGLLIRGLAQAFVGVIALGSLGVSFGGLFGLLSGSILEELLSGSGVWDFLAELSTGVVLVEGALALLGAVFVGYWLLVWLLGKMPAGMLLGVVGLTLLSGLAGVAFAVFSLGSVALVVFVGLAGLSLAIWLSMRYNARLGIWSLAPGHDRLDGVSQMAQRTARGTSVVMLSVAVLVGGFVLVDTFGSVAWWGGALVGLMTFWGVWRYLRRRYTVDERLILREMAGRRSRIASTLLGLSVGVTGLSLVSLTTGGASHLLEAQLEDTIEGNLVVMGWLPDEREVIREAFDELPGVQHVSQFTAYSAVLIQINNKRVEPPDQGFFGRNDDSREDSVDDGQNEDPVDDGQTGREILLSERESLENLPSYDMVAGRVFGPEDEGELRIMVRDTLLVEELGIKVGDTLRFRFRNAPGTRDDTYLFLKVIGIIAQQSEEVGFGDQFVVPPGTLSGRPEGLKPLPLGVVTVAMIDESNRSYMDGALVAMSEIPGTTTLEVGALTQLLKNLIEQLNAVPTLVAWLALVSGMAIIANTVALATQERRQQIGVMKAVGLKGRRVLSMLMIENGLIGLVAGAIGVGVGLLLTVILVLATRNPEELRETIEFPIMGWLMLMAIGVAVVAATLAAWSASAEKPMNVLRHE